MIETELEFRTLGGLDLRGGEPRPLQTLLGQPKRVALLAYLCVARPAGFQRRDAIVALLWPELDQRHARASLRNAVHGLRASLGRDLLISRGDDEIGIDFDKLWCDATAFGQAIDAGRFTEASELYRGDLLPAFFLPNAAEFERWLEGERSRLRRAAARAARSVAETHDAQRDVTGALTWTRRECALAPDDESALRRLLLLLERRADNAAALRTYDEFARRLATEYEARPSAETNAIVARLRRSPAADRAQERDGEKPLMVQAATDRAQTTFSPFGTTLPGYRVDREIGRGGMSVVYLGHDLRHHRHVAIKVMRPELAATLGTSRFLREIAIVAQLHHPHILPLFDSGQAQGLPYYVMPYVDAETLRSRIDDGPVPITEAIRILRDISSALACAHSHGIIHRDIKPENVLLSGGVAVVSDFGIATAVNASLSNVTNGSTGAVEAGFGTPSYMSPEQIAGGTVDHRADLYALGCLAYELLSGRTPFAGHSGAELIAGHLSQTPKSLSQFRSELDPALVKLVMQCLEKEPESRPKTATAFMEALDSAVARPSTSTSMDTRLKRWPGQRRAVYLGAALSLGAIGIGGSLYSRMHAAARPERNIIAIAPFSVVDTSLALWRDGLVDVLSRNLDGAGPLRAASPTSVLKHWAGRAEVHSAVLLASSVGAGLVTFGSLLPSGLDSVRANATIYDALAGEPLGDVEYRDDTRHLDRIADSLTTGILSVLARSRPIGEARSTRIGSHNFLALKEFLRGKYFERLGEPDSAVDHYSAAIALDSTFAIAYLERGMRRWGRHALLWDGNIIADFERAAQLNHGLSERDSLSIELTSTYTRLMTGRIPTIYTARLFRAAQAAANRFPDDTQLWMVLGETWVHLGSYFDGTRKRRQAIEIMKRAYDLDARNGWALAHIVDEALALNDTATVVRYVLASEADSLTNLGVLLDVLRSRPVSDARIDSMIRRGKMGLGPAGITDVTDSAEQLIRIQRRLLQSSRVRRSPREAFRISERLAGGLLHRGHIRAALGEDPIDPDYLLEWALMTRASRDSQLQVMRHSVEREPRISYWLLWFARQGDFAAIDSLARDARTHHPPLDRPLRWQEAEYIIAAAPGFHALAVHDSLTAARLLDAIPDSLCGSACGYTYLLRSRLANSQHRFQDAYRTSQYGFIWWLALTDVFQCLERAHAAEALGMKTEAASAYKYVLDAWRRPDPELEPYVADAARGLRRVNNAY